MKNLFFFAWMTAFFLLTGCGKDDNPTPVELTATEILIKKKWGLTGFAIRTDNGATHSLTKAQWQTMGITLDNLIFKTDGLYSSNGPSGTYTLKQDNKVLELTNEPYSPFIFTDLIILEDEFSGKSPVVKVNPQEPTITDAEQGVALLGLGGLGILKVEDVSKVKTVQLILTYTGE